MKHAGGVAVDDFVDPDLELADERVATERPWAAPVVQTMRLTSGPSVHHDEPRATTPTD